MLIKQFRDLQGINLYVVQHRVSLSLSLPLPLVACLPLYISVSLRMWVWVCVFVCGKARGRGRKKQSSILLNYSHELLRALALHTCLLWQLVGGVGRAFSFSMK